MKTAARISFIRFPGWNFYLAWKETASSGCLITVIPVYVSLKIPLLVLLLRLQLETIIHRNLTLCLLLKPHIFILMATRRKKVILQPFFLFRKYVLALRK